MASADRLAQALAIPVITPWRDGDDGWILEIVLQPVDAWDDDPAIPAVCVLDGTVDASPAQARRLTRLARLLPPVDAVAIVSGPRRPRWLEAWRPVRVFEGEAGDPTLLVRGAGSCEPARNVVIVAPRVGPLLGQAGLRALRERGATPIVVLGDVVPAELVLTLGEVDGGYACLGEHEARYKAVALRDVIIDLIPADGVELAVTDGATVPIAGWTRVTRAGLRSRARLRIGVANPRGQELSFLAHLRAVRRDLPIVCGRAVGAWPAAARSADDEMRSGIDRWPRTTAPIARASSNAHPDPCGTVACVIDGRRIEQPLYSVTELSGPSSQLVLSVQRGGVEVDPSRGNIVHEAVPLLNRGTSIPLTAGQLEIDDIEVTIKVDRAVLRDGVRWRSPWLVIDGQPIDLVRLDRREFQLWHGDRRLRIVGWLRPVENRPTRDRKLDGATDLFWLERIPRLQGSDRLPCGFEASYILGSSWGSVSAQLTGTITVDLAARRVRIEASETVTVD